MTRKILTALLALLCAGAALAPELAAKRDPHRGNPANKYKEPFHEVFDINTSESGTDSEIIFSKDGHAVICANHDGQRQNFYYTYTTGKGRIFLKGACIIAFDGKTWRKLPGVPEDIGLTLTDSRRPEYVMSGTGGKSGVTYRVSYLEKPKHSFMSYDEDWIVRFCAGGFLDNPQNVWKVTDPDGVKAVNDKGGKETAFGHGDIIIGSPDEKDGRYIAIDYIKGRKLYVEKSGVENLGSKDAVDSYLWEDAKSVINFSKWDSSLRFDEWDEDTAGWFNGWRAGRKSFWILFALLVAAAVLYVLNRIDYDPQSFFPDTLYNATTGVLMALTVVEVWYIISLQRDVLWIVFDVGIIGFLTFPVLALLLVLQLLLIHMTEINLVAYNGTYSWFPKKIEWIIGFIVMGSATGMMVTGNLLAGLGGYALLTAAGLPTTINYVRHSNGNCSMLPFMLLCYPVTYLLFLVYIVLQIAGAVASIEAPYNPNTCTVRDGNGNLVNLTPDSNGRLMGNDGREYHGTAGSGFMPDHPRDNEGPYY